MALPPLSLGVTKELIPNEEQIQAHLDHLFGGYLDGCHDGLIEIAWTDSSDGKLREAQLFGTDHIEDAVAEAVKQNRTEGQNVYVGAALRKPHTAPFGRAKDTDFFCLPGFYVDLDEEEAVRTASSNYSGCPPTCAVWTGKTPHPRVQLWWRHEEPERDPERSRQQNKALARALNGDPTVINPSRVMRLGGSIAWPSKAGRVAEMTEFVTFDDGRPAIYQNGQLAKAFGAAPPTDMLLVAGTTSSPDLGLGLNTAKLLAAISAGNWHDTMLRVVAHWVGTALPDDVILDASEKYTLAGWTAEQTRSDVSTMIGGARKKFGGTASTPTVLTETTPLQPKPIAGINPALIPPRPWIFGRRLLRRNVTLTVAPAGVGKTTLTIQEAIAIATGKEWAGQQTFDGGPVWLYNAEEDGDELYRRLFAALAHMGVALNDVADLLYLNSGAERPLLIARADRASGMVLRMPDVDACISHIKRLGIRVFIVDPFIEVHAVDENSNEQVKAVAAMFRTIAQEGDCAVHLVHHTRKIAGGSSDGHTGNQDTARGASALVGVARVVHTLFGMSEKDATKLDVAEEDRSQYLRLDGAKANLSFGRSATWFKRESVEIANGDEVGVLTPLDSSLFEERAEHALTRRRNAIVVRLLKAVDSEMSLNKAGLALIAQTSSVFSTYHGKDFDGRCPAKVRNEIEQAVASGTTVGGETFRIEERTGFGGGGNGRALYVVRGTTSD
jgi:hypothetical protein